MSEMVERVARAMHSRAIWDDGMAGNMPSQWEETGESTRTHYRQLARAAIEAMREPTPNMILAGMETDAEMTAIAYRAMIDAALKEPAKAD